ncbi:LysR substrate-binding domain-containing protein [Ruegeria sp. A3M17]|uniref:LysR substrate-binding domain-containing protein n=1 Tax=Ruegeria sp. A3M17 TaxID=2267229 RepID=UPI000DEA070E|nr:LysR substrate-binding domain-containing protein [Ruegeria sp. A3M17]RBW58816.1 hypothetical protein DS906_08470 [Ruegeria sp. A3M17]
MISIPGPDNLNPLHLAVVYCNGNIPGWDCVKILDVEMFPVAAPDIARQAEQSKVFSRQPQLEDSPPLLEFDNLAPDWINWQTWSKKVELTDFEKRSKVHCNSYVQSVGKALNGAGIALVNGSMLEEELSSGALVRIGEPSLRPGSAYYLCKKQGGGLSLNALALFQFLTT